jgi:hypothetical protein
MGSSEGGFVSSDPKRWSERGGGASPLEAHLVGVARDLDPPDGDQQAVWAALSAHLGPSAHPPSVEPAVRAHTGASALKLAAVALVAGTVGAVGSRLLEPAHNVEPQVIIAAPIPSASQTPPSPVRLEQDDAPPRVMPTVGPRHRVSARPPREEIVERPSEPEAPSLKPTDESTLEQEALQLELARGALRANDPTRALALIAEEEKRHQGGALEQERRVLLIEAAMMAGDRRRAEDEAKSFLGAHPSSPLAPRVRSILDASRSE